jgi:hypothetical protein
MQPPASPKLSIAVADARIPILCSMPPTVTSLEVPSGRRLGTMNSDRPLVPGGASGVRASTMWTMLSARS